MFYYFFYGEIRLFGQVEFFSVLEEVVTWIAYNRLFSIILNEIPGIALIEVAVNNNCKLLRRCPTM
jgi:hypothetical protein